MDRIDRAWRLWIIGILAGMLLSIGALGLIVVPIVQGESLGLDAYTSICRAFGINLGSAAPSVPATAPESRVAWTGPEFAALSRGDKAAGAELAQASCVACHAADGSSADPAIPRMAGQSAFAIYKELQDFKSGARTNDTMTPMVRSLEPRQMADVAAYYAALRRTDLDAAHPSFAGAEVEALALRGDSGRALPPCAACHAAGSGGPIETPSLAGQSAAYVTAQLQAFAAGARRNDVYERMRSIAAKLTPREIALLSAYYTTPH